jgi:ribose 1,5-bisphosphokinase
VSRLTETHAVIKSRAELIGPGRLVLVVGPSGAGKDTLINGARVQCASDSTVIFPRRVVTRPSSVHEDHETVDRDTFNGRLAEGRFALWWDAHGHRYGVPFSIDDDIRSSRTVVCNVSRTIVEPARGRYARVAVVLITAPERVLQARLASRDRQSDGHLADRVARSAEVADSCRADVSIHNVGEPMAGMRALLNVIRDPGTLS